MKYCTQCGNPVNGRFCPSCGAKVDVDEQPQAQASSYYTSQQSVPQEPQAAPQVDASQFKMGYHKFLIYFMLWLWAGLCVFNCISGPYYDFYGVCCLAYGAMAIAFIYVRFQLAAFKQNAPKKLLYVTIAYAVVVLVSNLVYADMAGIKLESSYISGPVLFVGAWGIGSWRYYASRSELFIN